MTSASCTPGEEVPLGDGGVECGGGCGADQVCSAGQCVDLPKSCPCPKESFCEVATNSCKVGCVSDDQCDAGRICMTGMRQCRTGCRRDDQCGSGQLCDDQFTCKAGCRTDQACPADSFCDTAGQSCKKGLRLRFAMARTTQLDLPQGTAFLRSADLNGDRRQDLFLTGPGSMNPAQWEGRIFLGKGDGTLEAPSKLSFGYTPSDVRLADLDDDGKLDRVMLRRSGDLTEYIVLTGNGDGTFTAKMPVQLKAARGFWLWVGKVDGDKFPDLIVAADGGQPALLLGKGDGTFPTERAVPVCAPGGNRLLVGDVDGDGKVDLVQNCGTTAAAGSAVALGKGDGTFQTATEQRATFFSGSQPSTADLNGDKRSDFILSSRDASVLNVYVSKADGSYQAQQVPVGNLPVGTAAADLNLDGALDLVSANSGSSDLSVLLGRGDGTFLPHVRVPAASGAAEVALTDMNGDDKPDAVVLTPRALVVLLNDSSAGN